MKLNLQKRAILMMAVIMLFAIGINTAVLTYVASDRFKNAILTKTVVIGENVQRDLAKALNLGIPIDSLEGLNEKFQDIISREKDISYMMIVSTGGKVLFHNNPAQAGKELKDKITSRSLSVNSQLIQRDNDFYDVSLPLLNAENKHIASIRTGVKSSSINSKLYNLVFWAMGVALMTFFLFVAIINFFVSRFIAIPIMNMEAVAREIAGGDLTNTINLKGNDEIASMGVAINTMATSLKDIIFKIRNITDTVSDVITNVAGSSHRVLAGTNVQKNAIMETAGAVNEIDNSVGSVAKSADDLFTLSGDTASSIMEMNASIEMVAGSASVFFESAQETASSIEEMIASIKQIAENLENLSAASEETSSAVAEMSASIKEVEQSANESVKLAEKVNQDASEKGMTALSAAINGMTDIKESVRALAEVINRLGKRSEEIGNILTVIDEVADQTNLLALNAAILAAQAGEHGKSFAVVADEIKSLAGKTAVSTKEIAALIASVQAETRSSVEMAAMGIQEVEKGSVLIRDVSGALNRIIDSSRTSTEMAKAIQMATAEEVHTINQITHATRSMADQITQIVHATEEQTRGSKFIVEASEKMKDLAGQVKTATLEQSKGSRQITDAVENVTHQTSQIADATKNQRERSTEIVKSMEKIQTTTDELIKSSNEMISSITILKDQTHNLLLELQKFKV